MRLILSERAGGGFALVSFSVPARVPSPAPFAFEVTAPVAVCKRFGIAFLGAKAAFVFAARSADLKTLIEVL